MKSLFSRPVVRLALLAAVASGTVAAAVAATPEVTVNLTGKTFGNGLDVHADSGAQRIFAAKSYGYEIEGTVHGTGLLAAVLPNGTDLADLIDKIQAGGSSFLTGVQSNPTGTLPFNVIKRTYSGNIPIPSLPGVSASASVTVKAKITATGLVRFDVTNVSVMVPFIDVGTVVFESGSKVTISVSPVIEFKKLSTTVSEDVGTVSLLVKRRFNTSGAVKADYTTVAGTATVEDYDVTSGTLMFADGETDKMIVVPITNRSEAQGDRTFKVKLSHPGGGAVLGVKRKEFVTITDAP